MDAVVDESAWRTPGAGLRPFVSWCSGFRQAGVGPARHRGVPSPNLTFIITLDDPLVLAVHPDPRRAPAAYATLVGGLHTAPALITHDGRQSGIQLGVTPLGARALFGMPAGALANWDGDASQVVGGFAAELQDRVREQRSWAGRFTVIDEMLGKRVAEVAGAASGRVRGGVRPEVAYVWRRLRAARGAVPIASLAAETGWSARYLGARFRAEIGLSPKAAARVFRFDHARRALGRATTAARGAAERGAAERGAAAPGPAERGPAERGAAAPGPAERGPAERGVAAKGVRLADIAAEAGYYDQAHLAAEFRLLAGCPPTQWLAEEFRFFQARPDDLGE